MPRCWTPSRRASTSTATAADIFGVPISDITSEQRRYKAVNFGLIYGIAFGLASQLGIERNAAQQFIDKYFARYPGVAEYMQQTRESARAKGYVETVFGRRLTLTDINGGNGPRRGAPSAPPSMRRCRGTAADHQARDDCGGRLAVRGKARDQTHHAGA